MAPWMAVVMPSTVPRKPRIGIAQVMNRVRAKPPSMLTTSLSARSAALIVGGPGGRRAGQRKLRTATRLDPGKCCAAAADLLDGGEQVWPLQATATGRPSHEGSTLRGRPWAFDAVPVQPTLAARPPDMQHEQYPGRTRPDSRRVALNFGEGVSRVRRSGRQSGRLRPGADRPERPPGWCACGARRRRRWSLSCVRPSVHEERSLYSSAGGGNGS